MSDETADCSADLSGSDPAPAAKVGQALVVLMTEGTGLVPPLVTPVDPSWPGRRGWRHPAEVLDEAYQDLLDGLSDLRRRSADMADLVARTERRITELETPRDGTGDDGESPEAEAELAELRRLLPRILAAYVEALGGRLEITARFAGERVTLR